MAQIRGGGALGGPAPVVVERGFSMIWASMGTEPTDSNNWNLPADSPFHFLFVSRTSSLVECVCSPMPDRRSGSALLKY